MGRHNSKKTCIDCNSIIHQDATRCRSCCNLKRFEDKRNHPWFGKTRDKKTNTKISKSLTGRKRPEITGEKHFNWKGGKSFQFYPPEFSKKLKKLIRERDNNICQLCSVEGNSVHHIDYIKNNCSPDNLITLCKSCHSKTNYNREDWMELFSKNNLSNILVDEIHSDERRKISLLDGLIDKDKEFTIIHLKKNKAIGACVHEGREYMCLIEGEIFCTIGHVREFLITGDARTIQPKKPHMFVAKEDSIIIEWGIEPKDKGKYNKEMRDEVNKINGKD